MFLHATERVDDPWRPIILLMASRGQQQNKVACSFNSVHRQGMGMQVTNR